MGMKRLCEGFLETVSLLCIIWNSAVVEPVPAGLASGTPRPICARHGGNTPCPKLAAFYEVLTAANSNNH